jgi:hypothetical protein
MYFRLQHDFNYKFYLNYNRTGSGGNLVIALGANTVDTRFKVL